MDAGAQAAPPSEGHAKRMVRRLAASLPSASEVLGGSLAWGLMYCLANLGSLYWRHEMLMARPLALFSLYLYGGALAFAPTLFLLRLAIGRRGVFQALLATFLLLIITHAATAGLFALQYRMYYAVWHEPFPSRIWMLQLIFTSAAAVYQFTVDSLYSYLPFLPLALLGFGAWFLRRAH